MLVLVVGVMVAGLLTMLLADALSNLTEAIFKITISKSSIAIGVGGLLAVTGLLVLFVYSEEDDDGEDNTVPETKEFDSFGRYIKKK